jgi:uncharacterized protein YcfL
VKVVIVSLLSLGLVGCASTPIKLISPEYKVVTVPQELYNCPTVSKFPDAKKLTNQQVGSLMLKLQQNNMTCASSLNAVKDYLAQAEANNKK